MEVCVFSAQRSYCVLHIAQSVCHVNESGNFAVFAQVARCENVKRRFTFFSVGDVLLDLLFEDHAAFHNEFSVARHRFVEVAVFVVGVFDILVAVVDREVVNIAELTEHQAVRRRFLHVGVCSVHN